MATATFGGSYLGENVIDISLEEYRSCPYISKCRILSHSPLRNNSVIIRLDEYKDALLRKEREKIMSQSVRFSSDFTTNYTGESKNKESTKPKINKHDIALKKVFWANRKLKKKII